MCYIVKQLEKMLQTNIAFSLYIGLLTKLVFSSKSNAGPCIYHIPLISAVILLPINTFILMFPVHCESTHIVHFYLVFVLPISDLSNIGGHFIQCYSFMG